MTSCSDSKATPGVDTVTMDRATINTAFETMMELETILSRLRKFGEQFGDCEDEVTVKALCDFGMAQCRANYEALEPAARKGDGD